MSHVPRHLRGGRFLEPKTLHPDHLRTLAARRKLTALKRLVGAWKEGTWRDVASYLGDEHKAGACCRIVTDAEFHPSIALIALIEAVALPTTSDSVSLAKRAKPRKRKPYKRLVLQGVLLTRLEDAAGDLDVRRWLEVEVLGP